MAELKVSRLPSSPFFNCCRPDSGRSCFSAMCWTAHASEIAQLLSISVSAVNSALHRARVTMAKQYHVDEQEREEGLEVDAATQALLERYLHAWETEDVAGLVALMKEDATFTMPPSPSWYLGREAIGTVPHHSSLCASGAEPLALLSHKG